MSKGSYLAVILSLVLGCGSAMTVPHVVDQHIVVINRDGRACESRHFSRLSEQGFHDWTDDVFAGMDDYHQNHTVTVNGKKVKRILIFIHGGLNSQTDALKHDVDHYGPIQDNQYYPIFINWDSDFASSYSEHLLEIRQGRKPEDNTDRIEALLSSPLYLFADVGRAIARAPAVWFHLASIDYPSAGARWNSIHQGQPHWLEDTDSLYAAEYYSPLAHRYAEPRPGEKPMAISMGREETTPRFWRWDTTKYVFTIPAKLLTTPLIDSLGQAAWDNMSRRTVTLFESPIYPRIHKSDADQMNYLLDYGPPGDLQIFLNRLRKHIADHGGDDAYDITIIGHSMGTMVINELLRHNPDLKIHNIVYMAAACTIHDFAKTTVPYLKAHAETQFYNLCLHPTCEITEAEYYELPPRGSLLLWIDEFLANPQTSLDRTLGRWDNILPAMYVIPDKIRDRVTIKAFAMTSNGSLSDPATGNSPAPQKHGDFTEVSYYVDSFWKARPADDKNLEGLVAQMDRRLQDVETSLPESRRLKLRNDTSATTRPVEKN